MVTIMRQFFSTYWLYIKTFFKSRAEYRAGFFFGLFANFYCYFITYSTYWVLINGLNNIGGWDFSDLSILYGLSLLSYSITATLMWYTIYNLSGIVTSGGLDSYLVRPEGVLRQLIWQRFGDTALAQILVTIIFLTAALLSKMGTLTLIKILYMFLAIIGGVLIQCGGMILIGAISFWTKRSNEIGRIFYYDMRELTQYPLFIFPKWIQLILTYIFPWAFINYYPALILLNKTQHFSDWTLGMLSPIVGVLFVLLSLLVFNQGLRRYSGAGN